MAFAEYFNTAATETASTAPEDCKLHRKQPTIARLVLVTSTSSLSNRFQFARRLHRRILYGGDDHSVQWQRGDRLERRQ